MFDGWGGGRGSKDTAIYPSDLSHDQIHGNAGQDNTKTFWTERNGAEFGGWWAEAMYECSTGYDGYADEGSDERYLAITMMMMMMIVCDADEGAFMPT